MMGKHRDIGRDRGSRDRKQDRIARAEKRAAATGSRHYNLTPGQITFCSKQIQTSKSNFVIRWGQLRIHALMTPDAGTTYVAYDPGLGEISFFIPRQNGRQLAREAAKYGKGKGKDKAPRLLLPPLQAKAQQTLAWDGAKALPGTGGTRTIIEAAPDPIGVAEYTAKLERTGLVNRINFLKAEVQKCLGMDLSDLKNWKEMQRMDVRREELEAELRALDAAKTKKSSTASEERENLLAQIDDCDFDLRACKVGDLAGLSIHREGLIRSLRRLIPNIGRAATCDEEQEALIAAIRSVNLKIADFQRTRRYGTGADHTADREKSKALRTHQRTMRSMWYTLFNFDERHEGGAAATTQTPPPEKPPPTQPAEEPPRGIEVVSREIAQISLAIDNSTNFNELMGMYGMRQNLVLEKIGMAPWFNGKPPTPFAVQKAKECRIRATEAHISWFTQQHDITMPEVRDLLTQKQAVLEEIVAEYDELYPAKEEKESNAPTEIEPLLGPR